MAGSMNLGTLKASTMGGIPLVLSFKLGAIVFHNTEDVVLPGRTRQNAGRLLRRGTKRDSEGMWGGQSCWPSM